MNEINRRQFLVLSGSSLLASQFAMFGADGEKPFVQADVCVYGATASGIMAAVAAAREGASVVIAEPSRWLGGMTGGGLMHIDWGREQAVGGTTRGILKRDYNDAQYRQAFAALLKEHSIAVIFEHRIASVQREETTIKNITLDFAPPDKIGCPVPVAKKRDARRVSAKVFIDCTYEGDLMARASVSYIYGRESRTLTVNRSRARNRTWRSMTLIHM